MTREISGWLEISSHLRLLAMLEDANSLEEPRFVYFKVQGWFQSSRSSHPESCLKLDVECGAVPIGKPPHRAVHIDRQHLEHSFSIPASYAKLVF